MAPLATGSQQIEKGIQHPSDIRRARPAAGPGGGDQPFYQPVLIVAQGLTRAEIANLSAAGFCPHGRFPQSFPSGKQPAIPHGLAQI